jgi:hypothetical protein
LRGSTASAAGPAGLLFGFARFGAGDSGFNGRFARVRLGGGLFCALLRALRARASALRASRAAIASLLSGLAPA